VNKITPFEKQKVFRLVTPGRYETEFNSRCHSRGVPECRFGSVGGTSPVKDGQESSIIGTEPPVAVPEAPSEIRP
jgi:hypothetical protein